MLLEFIDLNSHPVVAFNCDHQKTMGKQKMVNKKAWIVKKIDNIQSRHNKMTKWK